MNQDQVPKLPEPDSALVTVGKLAIDGFVGLIDAAFGSIVRDANAKAELKARQIQERTLQMLLTAVQTGCRVTRKEVCDSLEGDPDLEDWEIANKLDIPEDHVRLAIRRWYHIF